MVLKVTAFNGSPRGEKSNTHVMVQAFLEGAQDAGASVENHFLAKREIRHCLGCLHCWIKTPGQCIQKDDMAPLLAAYLESDIAVFATPLYIDNVTGIMKNFMDRLVPFMDPRFVLKENGETGHVKCRSHYPHIVAMSNCGYPEQSHFQVLELLFTRIARNMNAEFIARIYRGGGGLLSLKDPAVRPMVDEYKALVRKAGAEVVLDAKISPETAAALERQWVPSDVFNAQVNALWDRLMSRAREASENQPNKSPKTND